tara:strand:+ start:774 stop:1202 length:429 start_codon:yes stop_codon:yes gene_type:complete
VVPVTVLNLYPEVLYKKVVVMSDSITVFTFGDPSEAVSRAIAEDLKYYLTVDEGEGVPVVIGESHGSGTWFGDLEFCGSLVVSGIGGEGWAARVATFVAAMHGQDAIGVLHNDEGRTLAAAAPADGFAARSRLSTAAEVWSD